MEYVFCDRVHDAPELRDSFNALTRRVYGSIFPPGTRRDCGRSDTARTRWCWTAGWWPTCR